MAPAEEDPVRRYPGRGALKLLGALADLSVGDERITGRVCLDIGASHGGFTAVLLERGAARVYALDVAYGIFEYTLRVNPRVIPLERKNVRHLERAWFAAADLDRSPWFITCDVSFLSLGTVLAALCQAFGDQGPAWEGVFLVKPQFEDSRSAESGVVRDEGRRLELLENVRARARTLGLFVGPFAPARITGAKGNQEFCLWLSTMSP